MHAVYNYSYFVDLLPRAATPQSPPTATRQAIPVQHAQQQCEDSLAQTVLAGKQVADDT